MNICVICGLLLRQGRAHFDGFFALNAYTAGLGATWFSDVLGLGAGDRNDSGITCLRVPSGDGGGLLDGGVVGGVPLGVAENDVTAGHPVYVKPKVIGGSRLKAQNVIIDIGLPRQHLEAVRQVIAPAIRLDISLFHKETVNHAAHEVHEEFS